MSDEGIKLLVGLGNPGVEYAATRHNAGFWCVDRIAARHDGQWRVESRFHGQACRLTIAGQELRLLKPMTFMNRSGQSVSALARYFDIPVECLLVAHDELDLPVGAVRLKKGGGHAGHNGMRDTIAALGNRDFWRLRIGIGHPGDKRLVSNYVLSGASKNDEALIHVALDDVERGLADLAAGRFQTVMNQLHRTGVLV